MPESSLQSENITYRPHAARGCVKLQFKHIRNTYDRYTTIIIIIYENCTIRLASVGLAQARPNNANCKLYSCSVSSITLGTLKPIFG